ncbi:hypothetical protein ACFL4L_03590 [bacterium]
MLKWLVILVAVFAVVFAYFGGIWQNKDKIHRAELEMHKMRYMRDSLQTEVNFRDSLQIKLRHEVSAYKNEAEALRNQVDMMEEIRQEKQLSVRRLHKKEDLQARLRETFPEMAESDWGITEVVNEEFGVELEYLLIPLWFSETFIIDHQNAASWEKQKEKLWEADSLNIRVIALQDSIYTLEQLNRQAFEKGYQFAFFKYDSLNTEYIKELKKGKMNWGWQTAAFIGGGAMGYIIGKN